jgi:hypothetical protein
LEFPVLGSQFSVLRRSKINGEKQIPQSLRSFVMTTKGTATAKATVGAKAKATGERADDSWG